MFCGGGGERELQKVVTFLWYMVLRSLILIPTSYLRKFGGFVCVEVLRPSQPNGVMLSAVSLPNHTFTGQA